MRIQWTVITALLFALITAIFAVLNVESVLVNYIFGEARIPLILVILGSTLLGGLIVGMFGIVRQYRLQRTIKHLEKQLSEMTSIVKGEASTHINDVPAITADAGKETTLESDNPEMTVDIHTNLPKDK